MTHLEPVAFVGEATPAYDLPEHWTPGALDTFSNVIDARPDLGGADFSALEQACELIATADALEAEARRTGLMTKGSTGQLTVSPAITEARLCRTASAAILARLTVDRKGAMTSSERARHAAKVRWSNK